MGREGVSLTSACLSGSHTHSVLVYRPHYCLLSHHSWIHHPGLHTHAWLLHHRHHPWLLTWLHHARVHAGMASHRLSHLVETWDTHSRLTRQRRHHVVLHSHHLVLRICAALHYSFRLNNGLALLLGELADCLQVLI